ncbi:TonB-dependent receptor [Flavobacterium sp. xlx-214]|uniref:TonB-dependent receptor n=1 Tax=unclassified Flavobacterium TaxID=196869 RepID=UPI0013CF9772|nr:MULTISPECIES: TonB-dependent receptor [unclassified Flavobacterium]MBA5793662.1 TonB-dependent receptor [Flavobacterium sp. xlx-221]QMI84588.1 TonB-dependent receptor [Flavobacterium sp. xlx-214]
MKHIYLFCFLIISFWSYSQISVEGKVYDASKNPQQTIVYVAELDQEFNTNEEGLFTFDVNNEGVYHFKVVASSGNFVDFEFEITSETKQLVFELPVENTSDVLDEVVISGTLKPVLRSESLVPVEVYTPTFFKKNPTANIFEALQIVNGVKPQVNCSVCNTGDIHINGLEGPYTFVLIDGMPIVSGLSTVYGLSGIPNSLIEKVEIVKGPASSLYGSEAVGGLINIITKNPLYASKYSVDVFGTSWGEVNTDVGLSVPISKKVHWLLGVNYFNYSNPIDKNKDNFTDVTLQDRISFFNKFTFDRKSKKQFSVATRYFYEDRWGGEMNWKKQFRGGEEVYGESIYTNRWEVLGLYELPFTEKITSQFSFTSHDQNSVYGNTPFLAQQTIAFAQLYWDKSIGKHDLLLGTAARYQYYDDNSVATKTADNTTIPSVFLQDSYEFNDRFSVLGGLRYDYHKKHKSIFTPRLAFRYESKKSDIIRLNAGTGFRVVNLFTEEHAALTGARDVVVLENLNPEKSYNVNLNYLKTWMLSNNFILQAETSAWYTYFTNSIIPDYDTNPNQIIYKNLKGYAETKGLSVNIDGVYANNLKIMMGATFQDVNKVEDGVKTQQMLTERFSGTWAVSYTINSLSTTIDYSGSLYGSMRLPLVSDLDPRLPKSKTYSLQNIQITYKGLKHFEFYGGVKNILNWTPNKNNPFIIARTNDPFNKKVQFDANGNAMPTSENPYGLVFDPTYIYAPNQGIRTFFGVRFSI